MVSVAVAMEKVMVVEEGGGREGKMLFPVTRLKHFNKYHGLLQVLKSRKAKRPLFRSSVYDHYVCIEKYPVPAIFRIPLIPSNSDPGL